MGSNTGLRFLRHKLIRLPWARVFGRRYLLFDPAGDLYLDLGDIRGPSAAILKRGLASYEAESVRALEPYLSVTGTFVDAGANIGSFTLQAARSRPGLSVVAFEPHPFLLSLLQDNLKLAKLQNARAIQAALSDREGSAEFFESSINSGGHSLLGLSPLGDRKSLGQVRLLTLDGLSAEDLPRPILAIKVDVEGHELQVFRGGEKILKEDRPAVVFEHSPWAYEAQGLKPIEVPLFLEERGYRFRWLDGGEGEPWLRGAAELLKRLGDRPFSQVLAEAR